MQYLEKYKSLDRTLFLMKLQVVDSLEYAREVCPRFSDPRDLWDWLKPKLTFEDDGVHEELRTMQTLFARDGYGDCDCFVITTLACLVVNDIPDVFIDLAGYTRTRATHIYSDTIYRGRRVVLDFTNPAYDQERRTGPRGTYQFRQRIPVKYKNWGRVVHPDSGNIFNLLQNPSDVRSFI